MKNHHNLITILHFLDGTPEPGITESIFIKQANKSNLSEVRRDQKIAATCTDQ